MRLRLLAPVVCLLAAWPVATATQAPDLARPELRASDIASVVGNVFNAWDVPAAATRLSLVLGGETIDFIRTR